MADSLDDLLAAGYRYAHALVHRADATEDLLQDAWVSVLRAGGPHEIGYLFRSIRTRFIDAYRRDRLVMLEPVDPADMVDLDPTLPDDVLDASLELGSAAMIEALGRLREDEREALFLQGVSGHTASEIGELMGRPRGTVLSLLHRAKRKLRDMLDARDVEARK